MKAPDHIRKTSVQIEGQFRPHTLVKCPACKGERTFPYVPPEVMARFLADKGYLHGLDAKRCRCPACLAKPVKPAIRPDQKRAAYCRIAGVPRAAAKTATALPPSVLKPMEPKAMPATAQPARAEPPRELTREDRRRILDALEAAYDLKRGCYNADGSDDKLARHLNVPRAWVAEVRGLVFGEDVSAAKFEAPAKLKALEAKFMAQSERLLTLAQESEKMAGECRAALALMGGGA